MPRNKVVGVSSNGRFRPEAGPIGRDSGRSFKGAEGPSALEYLERTPSRPPSL